MWVQFGNNKNNINWKQPSGTCSLSVEVLNFQLGYYKKRAFNFFNEKKTK